jgi:hypothetical protein
MNDFGFMNVIMPQKPLYCKRLLKCRTALGREILPMAAKVAEGYKKRPM